MTASTEFVVAPLTPAVGGLVSGVDLSRPLSERTVQGLRRALAERHVLFFQNQTLEAATQRDFASQFGKLHVHPVYRHVEGVPEITLIETKAELASRQRQLAHRRDLHRDAAVRSRTHSKGAAA